MTEREGIVDYMRAKAAFVDCTLGRHVEARAIDELADEVEQKKDLPGNRDPRYPCKRVSDCNRG